MPELTVEHDFLDERPLKLALNLLHPVSPSKWEGWIAYDIKLLNGKSIVACQTGLAILDQDVTALCQLISSGKDGIFQPLEPDFSVRLSQKEESSDIVEVDIYLDEGVMRSSGIVGSGIGMKMLIENSALRKFGESLKKQMDLVVKDVAKIS